MGYANSPRCLVTGGTGNLAMQLEPLLRIAGYQVVLWDVTEPPRTAILDSSSFIRGDLCERQHVRSVVAETRPQVILHFASLLSGASEANRQQAWKVNVDATLGLFEEALNHQVETILFLSSLASFGAPLPSPVPEDYPQWPTGMYGVNKVAVERLGHYYHIQHGLDFRCLRLPIVLSSFAHAGAASAYASMAFLETSRTGRYTFHVRPTTRAALIYIKDVLPAIIQMLQTPANSLTRRSYNIQAISPTAEQLRNAIQVRCPGAVLDFQPDSKVADLIDSWPQEFEDVSARQDWGWSPQYDLDSMSDDFLKDLGSSPI